MGGGGIAPGARAPLISGGVPLFFPPSPKFFLSVTKRFRVCFVLEIEFCVLKNRSPPIKKHLHYCTLLYSQIVTLAYQSMKCVVVDIVEHPFSAAEDQVSGPV